MLLPCISLTAEVSRLSRARYLLPAEPLIQLDSRISPLWYSSTLSNPLLESEKSLGVWNRSIGVCSHSAVVGRALTSRQVPVAALPLGGQRPWSKLLISASSFSVEDVIRSVVSDSVTPWTVACQVPLSVEFSRQEYSG